MASSTHSKQFWRRPPRLQHHRQLHHRRPACFDQPEIDRAGRSSKRDSAGSFFFVIGRRSRLLSRGCLVNSNISNPAKVDVPYAAVFHSDPHYSAGGHIHWIAAAAISTRIVGVFISVSAIVSANDLIAAERGGSGNTNVKCSAADRPVLCLQYYRLPFWQLDACGVSSGSAAVTLRSVTTQQRRRTVASQQFETHITDVVPLCLDVESYC